MSAQISQSHEELFKRVLEEPEFAGAFLRNHLPPSVAVLLSDDPVESVPVSFVDEELRDYYSDLLFRFHLKTGSEAFAYMLVEHEHAPDHSALLQLSRYVIRILSDWYKRHDRLLALPPVLPLLASRRPTGWRSSPEFVDLFGAVPGALRPYLPSFRLGRVDLDGVAERPLPSTEEEDADNDKEFMSVLGRYFLDTVNSHGEARSLIRVLESRFGSLPDTARNRILKGSASEREAWAGRVCQAPDLESFFD